MVNILSTLLNSIECKVVSCYVNDVKLSDSPVYGQLAVTRAQQHVYKLSI